MLPIIFDFSLSGSEGFPSELTTGTKMAELLKRTELDYEKLAPIDEERPKLTKQEKEEVEIQIKYEGYIKMQEAQVEKNDENNENTEA